MILIDNPLDHAIMHMNAKELAQMTQKTPPMTRSQVQAAYDAEVATIRAAGLRGEHAQGISMAMNEARRWLDRELDQALPDPVAATTLGHKLRASMAEAERLRLSALEQIRQQARERAEKPRQAVDPAIVCLKARITASINYGSIPAPIRMRPALDDKTRYGVSIQDPQHELYDLWQAQMETWAQQEGLVLQVQHAHDVGGMESWWNLVVKPA